MQRKLVLAPANRGDEPLGESLIDDAAVHLRRPSNRAHQRVVIHAGHEILRTVDRLGEAGEAGAFAEEFRAHGDDHMQVDAVRRALFRAFARRALDEIHEQLRFVATGLFLVAEQFLELVDEQAQALAPDAFERGGDRSEARRAGAETTGDGVDMLEIAGAALEPGELGGEVPQRSARGAHGAGQPGRVVAAVLERELRQDARANQRRLPRARYPVDQHQPALDEAADHLVDHLFPAEEDRPFLFVERTQPRIRPLGPRNDGQSRCHGAVFADAGARAASIHSRNFPRHSARLRSKRSIPNGATSNGRLSPVLSSTAHGIGAPRAP